MKRNLLVAVTLPLVSTYYSCKLLNSYYPDTYRDSLFIPTYSKLVKFMLSSGFNHTYFLNIFCNLGHYGLLPKATSLENSEVLKVRHKSGHVF